MSMPRIITFTVDLTNATKYPDIDEFFGFTTVSLIYMYIASTVPDFIAIVGNIIILYTSLRNKCVQLMQNNGDLTGESSCCRFAASGGLAASPGSPYIYNAYLCISTSIT